MSTTSGYLAHLKVDGEALAIAASLGLHKPVPSCPDWDVAELMRHTGRFYRNVAGRIRSGDPKLEHPEIDDPPDRIDVALVAWNRDGLEELLDVLSSYPLDAPCWTWSGPKVVSFWHRRAAQEIAVHRWDAENATGRVRPIAASLAPDGIDEVLDVFLGPADPPYEGPQGTVRLRATDAGRTWFLRLEAGEPLGRGDETATPDLTVKGSASDLMLLLWGRYRLKDVGSEGNASLWYGYRKYNEQG